MKLVPATDTIEPIDPLKQVIIHITAAMKVDFGQQYAKLYADHEELRQFKRRLYAKMKGSSIEDIKTAYEDYVDSGNPFCPTIVNLITFIIKAEKERRKKENNDVEADRVKALPAPTIECNPLELLAKAKLDRKNDAEYTKEERAAKHQDNMRLHTAKLIADSSKIKHRYAGMAHLCKVDGCNLAGTLSGGTSGGDNFYCSAHYRMAN